MNTLNLYHLCKYYELKVRLSEIFLILEAKTIQNPGSSRNFSVQNSVIRKHGERNPLVIQKKRNNHRQPMAFHQIQAMDIFNQRVRVILRNHLLSVHQTAAQYQLHRHLYQIRMCRKADCRDFSLLGDQLVQVI